MYCGGDPTGDGCPCEWCRWEGEGTPKEGEAVVLLRTEAVSEYCEYIGWIGLLRGVGGAACWLAIGEWEGALRRPRDVTSVQPNQHEKRLDLQR